MASENSDAGAKITDAIRLPAPELGRRIEATCDLLGTRQRAAEIAGISTDQLLNQVREKAKPGFAQLVRLAAAADVSLDWLATGEGEMMKAAPMPSAAISEALLTMVLEKAQAHLDAEGLVATPMEMGRLCTALYMVAVEAGGRVSDNTLAAIFGLMPRR